MTSDEALSSYSKGECECCKKIKQRRLYVLQNGETAWVCDDCREGKHEVKST